MCGGGNHAAEQAAQAETDRQGRISGNVSAINSAYAGREPQYADFRAALQKQFGTELGRQQQVAQRHLKFSLAKTGNTGGSVAVDQGAELNREAAQGALTAEQHARGAEAKLRSADEQSRLGMISVAQSGGDIGNAATQTANSLRANIEGARSEGQAQGLGDLFGGTADIYKKSQDAAQFRKGLGSTIYGSPWGLSAAGGR
jgi:hypothetical protein